jgi:hypothetical protein
MNYSLIIEWSIVVLLLLALVYTMIVIKEEPRSYLENAKHLQFAGLQLLVPSWWTQTLNTTESISFERTDTNYEWKATLSVFDWTQQDQDIEKALIEWLHAKEVLFDEINSVIHNPSDYKDHESVQSGEWEIVRLEGTATQAETKRIYLDTYLIRDKINKKEYYCESRSSVLNGIIEGPYFEAMMNRAKQA